MRPHLLSSYSEISAEIPLTSPAVPNQKFLSPSSPRRDEQIQVYENNDTEIVTSGEAALFLLRSGSAAYRHLLTSQELVFFGIDHPGGVGAGKEA